MTVAGAPRVRAGLSTVAAADIPEHLHPDDQRPGQYL